MKNILSLFSLSSLLVSFMLAGCAAPSDDAAEPADETEEEVSVTEDALSIQGAIQPKLFVTINDPTQRARSIARNVVVLRGFASGGGVVPSSATVQLDGTSFKVPVSGTAFHTASKIEGEIGPGYDARVIRGRWGAAYLVVRYQQP